MKKPDIMEQIFAIEANESSKMAASSRVFNRAKPIVENKSNHRISIEEKKVEEKKGAVLEVIKEIENQQDKARPIVSALQKIQERKYEKLENEQLLNLLTKSFSKLSVSNHVDDEGFVIEEESEDAQSVKGQEIAQDVEKTFRSMEAEFDILEELEKHGDLNDPVFLRSELKRNSFILAQQKLEQARRERQIDIVKKKH